MKDVEQIIYTLFLDDRRKAIYLFIHIRINFLVFSS